MSAWTGPDSAVWTASPQELIAAAEADPAGALTALSQLPLDPSAQQLQRAAVGREAAATGSLVVAKQVGRESRPRRKD